MRYVLVGLWLTVAGLALYSGWEKHHYGNPAAPYFTAGFAITWVSILIVAVLLYRYRQAYQEFPQS